MLNQKKGGFKLYMRPSVGEKPVLSFNLTHKDMAKRKLFNDLAKRLARRGAIDAIDTGLLERYCRMRLLTSAQLKLAEAGDQAARKFVLRANSQLLAMERELGLTPASRGEVRPQPPKQVEDEKAQRYGLIG